MSTFSLEDFDAHIENLRSQLLFLNEALDATDHTAPDWLATDLISLRNKSGRLQDDMQRFRDRIENEGLGTKKASKRQRLSLEGAKASNSSHNSDPSMSQNPPISPPNASPQAPRTEPQPVDGYVVQHIDVTEEVNRRLRENRLRRLMDSPRTSQKRKYDAFEVSKMESTAETEDDVDGGGTGFSDRERTPVKRLKSSGTFEQMLKRKENGIARGDADEQLGERIEYKRRKI